MKINLDRKSSQSLSRQIADQIRDHIRSGVLDPGEKLPSTRLLSKELEVNRITVSQAYGKLLSEGLVRSGVGSGTYVTGKKEDLSLELDRSNYAPIFSKGVQALRQTKTDFPVFAERSSNTINFATLIPDERFFPVKAFGECLDQVLTREGSKILQYCGTLGYPPLREHLAERMRNLGIPASADHILIVNGAQQGIDLVLRCFLSPGDKVALSVPTYHHIFPIIALLMAEISPVSTTDEGPDLDSLAAATDDPSVRLVYIMPNFQNPTGVTCGAERRTRIYEIAAERNLPILEDDFEKDLTLEDEGIPPIKALDREGKVIYLGTFSKSLFPGLRIGWLVASPETLKALSAVKKATDLENSALLQAAVHAFCLQGHYDRHLLTIRALIRERMDAAFQSLEAHMPEGVSWNRPAGGYVLWIGLPEGVHSERIFAMAKSQGVLVTPGTLFSHQGNDPRGIRLSLSRTGVQEIQRGIEILSRVIEGETRSVRREEGPLSPTPQHL